MTNEAETTEHGDACICTECLPPGVERERILVEHWREHMDEYDRECAEVRS